jgi:hypothetical protein
MNVSQQKSVATLLRTSEIGCPQDSVRLGCIGQQADALTVQY